MLKIVNLPAFWGFWGSLIYAGGRLSSVLIGEARDHPEAVRRAWMQFVVAIIFGPVAAQAFGPQILDWIGHHTRPEATYFAIGLSVNSVWPTIEQMAWPSMMAWIGNQLQSVGKVMSAAEAPKGDAEKTAPGDETGKTK